MKSFGVFAVLFTSTGAPPAVAGGVGANREAPLTDGVGPLPFKSLLLLPLLLPPLLLLLPPPWSLGSLASPCWRKLYVSSSPTSGTSRKLKPGPSESKFHRSIPLYLSVITRASCFRRPSCTQRSVCLYVCVLWRPPFCRLNFTSHHNLCLCFLYLVYLDFLRCFFFFLFLCVCFFCFCVCFFLVFVFLSCAPLPGNPRKEAREGVKAN